VTYYSADISCAVVLQVVTEQRLVEHSEAFESAVSGRDRAALQVRSSSNSVGSQ
jgi:hypothetical protein